MSNGVTILAGSIGEGLWVSWDSGDTWQRPAIEVPAWTNGAETDIRAVAVSPLDPSEIWASATGAPGDPVLLRSVDGGVNFALVEAPLSDCEIWSIGLDPHDRDAVFVGTRPAGVFRSRDAGKSWEKLDTDAATSCPVGSTRLTSFAFHPDNPGEVWASIEIGAILRSSDGGDTWAHVYQSGAEETLRGSEYLALATGVFKVDDEGGIAALQADTHCVVLSVDADSTRVLSTGPIGLFVGDGDKDWEFKRPSVMVPVKDGFYSRGVVVKADDPNTIFVGTGDVTPGTAGVIQRSTDRGQTWAPVGPEVNSIIWDIDTHPSAPDTIVAVSIYGRVLISTDGGSTWRKLDREFGELRALAVTSGR
jgi:photosystem II stability/assembly factor-like uncharacterized protein